MIALFAVRVFWLENPPTFDAIMVVVGVLYIVWFLAHHGFRYYALTPTSLRWVAANLHDPTWHRNRRACFLLKRMVGDRYGNRLELWRRWYDRYGATLVWHDGACRYVEAELVGEGDR